MDDDYQRNDNLRQASIAPTYSEVHPFSVEECVEVEPPRDTRAPLIYTTGISGQKKECLPRSPQRGTTLEASLKRSKASIVKEIKIRKSQRKVIERLLQALDQDDDGFVTLAELQKGLPDALEKGLPREVANLAEECCEKDFDHLLDLDEFIGVRLIDEPSMYERHKQKCGMLTAFIFFALAPAVYIPCNPHEDGERWSVWDAVYFAAVTVTTVGYGDFGPKNDNMKIFTIIYILFGLGIVAQIVTDFTSAIVAQYEAKMEAFNRSVMENMNATAKMATESNMDKLRKATQNFLPGTSAKCFTINNSINKQVLKKIYMSLILFLSPVLLGTVFFHYNEGWTLLDAFYWSVVTLTTVGYGDMTLENESSRIFSFFFILFGFGFVGAALGNIGEIQMERRMEIEKRKILGRQLSMELLDNFDQDGNGVDLAEFLCAMLVQMKKVSEDDLLPLIQKFHQLDVDRSGVLNKEDLSMMRAEKRQIKRRTLVSERPETP